MTIDMRAVTVRPPWSEAIIRLGKDVENRSRNIAGSYRGPVAIHAGLRVDPFAYDHHEFQVVNRIASGWGGYQPHHDRGAIVGVVDLVDVHHADGCGTQGEDQLGPWHEICSPWAMADHWHLVLVNPRTLREPIPFRGRLGLWHLPNQIITRITEQLGATL